MMRSLLWLVVALFLGCGFRNDPLPTTPTADNPCGASYTACTGPDGALNGMCCDENNTCGGGKFSVGCPAGMCCFIGEDGLFGARKPTKQWKAGDHG